MNNRKKLFRGIISEIDFNKMTKKEKEKFLVKHQVYINKKTLEKTRNYHESLSYEFHKTHSAFIKSNPTLFHFKNKHPINPHLIDELIDLYKDEFLGSEIEILLEKKILHKVFSAFDKSSEIDIIKNLYEKYSKKIYKIHAFYWSNTNYILGDFIEDIWLLIPNITYVDFITGKNINFSKIKVFQDYTKIQCYKNALNLLDSLNSTQNNLNDKGPGDYYSKYFTSKNSEQIFYNILLKLEVIDKNNNIKNLTNFKSVCNSIYYLNKRHDNFKSEISILKDLLLLKDFIKYLNHFFSAEIKDTSKISNSSKFDDEVRTLYLYYSKEI